MPDSTYYSMRQLSPYQGTVQLVQLGGSRAMSVDGFNWEVQIKHPGVRYASYGVWRSGDSSDLEDNEETQDFIEALRHHPPLPFPAADKLELWLLSSRDSFPLALLASTLDRDSPPNINDVHWQPTLADDDSFVAPSLGQAPMGRDDHGFISHRDIIDRCVRTAAGLHPSAQWFRRDEAGDGTGLNGCRLDPALTGRQLSATDIPALLIREDWEGDQERRLIQDYHAWQAANLLTHTNLARETRDSLEHAACLQPNRLYQVRKLIPEIINTELIKTALVKATIRHASGGC